MKKIRLAWKRFLLWIGAAAMLLSGCAGPVETAAPAMRLDMAQMVATAKNEGGKTISEQVSAPARYQAKIETGRDALEITVDASVELPSCDVLPVYRVQGVDFTQAQIDRLYERLRVRTALAAQPPVLEAVASVDEKTGDVLCQTFRADAAAEDAYFCVINSSDLDKPIRLDAYRRELPARNAQMRFEAYHEYGNFGQHSALRLTDEAVIPPVALGNLTATPAQARSEVTTLLEDFGMTVTDIYLTDNEQFGWIDGIVSEASEYAYIILCARNVEGAPCVSSRRFFSTTHDENGEPEGTWSYEWIEILYTRDGICQFSWFSPVAVTGVVLPETKLLPFSEIMAVFSKMILAVNPLLHAQGALRDKGLYDAGSVIIDKIVLSYQRICGTERYDEGFFVPAWSFYGHESYDLNTETDELVDAGNVPPDALLIINAIDGSVINLAKGY